MPRQISKAARVPLYERIKEHVASRIKSGEWAPGTRLPSEHELVATLGVSRMTVHRAFRELGAEGLVARVQGRGTFAASPRPQSSLIEIRDIADEIAARGHSHSVRLIRLEPVRADQALADAFDTRVGGRLFHSVMVHAEDGVPIQYEERMVTPFFAPQYLEQDFATVSTTKYLQGIANPTQIMHEVFAICPRAEICRELEIGPNEACLQLVRRTWVNGVPATKTWFTYPGSRYSLAGRYDLARS